ncbi:hypothetical protein C8J35_102385 [Rhizobium sp. PP-F2F-G38]|nr:hypothetical protein C8J37_102385 [Rhizobium sp. PP-WC-1G-195]PYE99496.1 hypothetical protein C8J35_102385 [Rhizobium sp. PP-F2F-G38]
MISQPDVDLALFGAWEIAPAYDAAGGLERQARQALRDTTRIVVLDTKATATAPRDELQEMLNIMTRELREQMQRFQVLRDMALSQEAAGNGEIDRKQVQADAKASIEAMSVIVRTLEKIDTLQRTIADDRRRDAEAKLETSDYDTMVEALRERIEERAEARARQLFGQWQRDAGDSRVDPAGGAAGIDDADPKPP